jgi:hypothetical protein
MAVEVVALGAVWPVLKFTLSAFVVEFATSVDDQNSFVSGKCVGSDAGMYRP